MNIFESKKVPGILAALAVCLSALATTPVPTVVKYSAQAMLYQITGNPAATNYIPLTSTVTLTPFPFSSGNITVLSPSFYATLPITVYPDTNGLAYIAAAPNDYMVQISGISQAIEIAIPSSTNILNMADLVIAGTGTYTYTNNANYGVLVDSNDTTAGWLTTKILAGQNVTMTITNIGGNEKMIFSFSTNISVGGIVTNLPSNIAYQNSNQVWTAVQQFLSQTIFGNTAIFSNGLQIGGFSLTPNVAAIYGSGFGISVANGLFVSNSATVFTNYTTGAFINYSAPNYYIENSASQVLYITNSLVGGWLLGPNGSNPTGTTTVAVVQSGAILWASQNLFTNATLVNAALLTPTENSGNYSAGTFTGSHMDDIYPSSASGSMLTMHGGQFWNDGNHLWNFNTNGTTSFTDFIGHTWSLNQLGDFAFSGNAIGNGTGLVNTNGNTPPANTNSLVNSAQATVLATTVAQAVVATNVPLSAFHSTNADQLSGNNSSYYAAASNVVASTINSNGIVTIQTNAPFSFPGGVGTTNSLLGVFVMSGRAAYNNFWFTNAFTSPASFIEVGTAARYITNQGSFWLIGGAAGGTMPNGAATNANLLGSYTTNYDTTASNTFVVAVPTLDTEFLLPNCTNATPPVQVIPTGGCLLQSSNGIFYILKNVGGSLFSTNF